MLHRRLLAQALATGAALGLLLGSTGCVDRSRRQYEFVIRVQSDPGRPLAKVTLAHAGKVLGASDAQGLIRLAAQGREGETVAFEVRCPDGYRQSEKPLSVLLRKPVEANKRPEYWVTCPPLKRTVVVAVRAERGPNLPVLYLGKELGRTDSSGAAHVAIEAEPEDVLELTLDTSSEPSLRPSNPSARFVVGTHDELLAFTQEFQAAPKPRAAKGHGPRGPVRIQID